MASDAEVITRQNPLLMLQRVLRRATLPTFRLYDLRHTFASLLLSAAAPLLFVSQALGHTNPTTTLKYYAHWIPTGGRRYVDVLDGAADQSWDQKLAPSGPHEPLRQESVDFTWSSLSTPSRLTHDDESA